MNKRGARFLYKCRIIVSTENQAMEREIRLSEERTRSPENAQERRITLWQVGLNGIGVTRAAPMHFHITSVGPERRLAGLHSRADLEQTHGGQ